MKPNIFIKRSKVLLFVVAAFLFTFQTKAEVGIHENLRSGYHVQDEKEIIDISWDGVDSDGEALIPSLGSPFCLFRHESLPGDTDKVYSPAFTSSISAWTDEESEDHDLSQTGLIDYWGFVGFDCWSNQNGNGLTPTTNEVTTVPRIFLDNTEQNGNYVTSEMTLRWDYTGASLWLVPYPDHTLDTVIDITEAVNFPNQFLRSETPYEISFSTNGLGLEDGQTYYLVIYGGLQPFETMNVSGFLAASFPPPGFQISNPYIDVSSPVTGNELEPLEPPSGFAVSSIPFGLPSDVVANWVNEDEYDQLFIRSLSDGGGFISLAGNVSTFSFNNQAIGQSNTYEVYAVKGTQESVAVRATLSADALAIDDPVILGLENGIEQFTLDAGPDYRDYNPPHNDIALATIRCVNVDTQAVELFEIENPSFPIHHVIPVAPATYNVSLKVELANGIQTDYFPAGGMEVTSEEAVQLPPPPVLGIHAPGNEIDTYYRVRFQPEEGADLSAYTKIKIRDYYTQDLITVLRPTNNPPWTKLVQVAQLDTGRVWVQGFHVGEGTQSEMVEKTFSYPQLVTDYYVAIKGEQAPYNRPGHVAEFRVYPNLPENLPSNPYASAKVIIEDQFSNERISFDFDFNPGAETELIIPLEYSSDHSGDGRHEYNVFVEVYDSGNDLLSRSDGNTSVLNMGVSPWDINDDGVWSSFFDQYCIDNPLNCDPYLPGDFISLFAYNAIDLDHDNPSNITYKNIAMGWPAVRCIEILNTNGNALPPMRPATPPAPEEICFELDDLPGCPSSDGDLLYYNTGDPWQTPNLHEFAHCDPRYSEPEGDIDLYDGDATYYWGTVFLPDEEIPVRGRVPGYYDRNDPTTANAAPPPTGPGELDPYKLAIWGEYDPNNTCHTNYVHNQENGAYNPEGIPCVHGPENPPGVYEAFGESNWGGN